MRLKMNHYLIHLAFLLSVFTLSSVSNAAQPDAVSETHAHESSGELDEPQLFEFKTSGFSFDIEVPFEPVVRESTNSSIYAVTIQRRAVDGLALGTDGLMAFVRFSQTIDPLDEIGTIEELDKATMDDAIRSIRKAFGEKNRLTTSATSMEILGKTREGKRIDVGLLENGTSVFVECYTFVSEDGNGIGITLKYLDPIGDEIPIDTLIADQLLSGLEVHKLTPESSYIHSLGGYPIRIPVRSKVQSAKRLNKFVSEATIAYEYGSLRFQMIEFPEGVRGAQVARDQLNGYENALNQQHDQGQLEILWDSHSAVVAGTDGSAVLPGLTHAIRMNDQEFLSTMYTAIDDGIVIVANFSGNIEHADRLSTYADQFFKRPIASANSAYGTDFLAGLTLSRPMGLSVYRSESDDFIYSTMNDTDWAGVSVSPATANSGYTRIRVLDGSDLSIEELIPSMFPSGFTQSNNDQLETGTYILEDGREAQQLSVLGAMSDGMGEEAAIRVTSYLFGFPDSDQKVLVSSISYDQTHTAQTLVTQNLIERLETDEHGGSIDLPFGSLSYDHENIFVSRSNPRGVRDELRISKGEDSMTIKVLPIENDDSQSDDELATTHLIPAWVAGTQTNGTMNNDSIEITQHEFLGDEASMIDLGVGEDGSRTRAIGLRTQDSYTTIVIRITDGDESKINQLLSLIESQ